MLTNSFKKYIFNLNKNIILKQKKINVCLTMQTFVLGCFLLILKKFLDKKAYKSCIFYWYLKNYINYIMGKNTNVCKRPGLIDV